MRCIEDALCVYCSLGANEVSDAEKVHVVAALSKPGEDSPAPWIESLDEKICVSVHAIRLSIVKYGEDFPAMENEMDAKIQLLQTN